MFKRGRFVISTTAGLAAFGAIAWMQSSHRSLTSEPRVDLRSFLDSAVSDERVVRTRRAASSTVESGFEKATLLLPPVYIVGDALRTPQRLEATPRVEPVVVPAKPMEGCSPWRDMGPTNVDEGVPSGVVRVRDLC